MSITFNFSKIDVPGLPGQRIYGIAYGKNKYIAIGFTWTDTIGQYRRIYSSLDGIIWNEVETPIFMELGWKSLIFANNLFVAVSETGTGNRVATSPDGINWTSRSSAADNNWQSIAYGNGNYVAVATSGSGNRVMTSPDGINWTSRSSAADNNWTSVTYGNNLFVAVATSGIGNRVMTSPDGINWTIRSSAADNNWSSVTYGNNLFVAVSNSGIGNRVMTSSDGINWVSRVSPANNNWSSVTYGNNLFVAVSNNGTNNRAMYSSNGIDWTTTSTVIDRTWTIVKYLNDKFIAFDNPSAVTAGYAHITSIDGITWTNQTNAELNLYSVAYNNNSNNPIYIAIGSSTQIYKSINGINWVKKNTGVTLTTWKTITYGNNKFVALANNGTGNRCMYSSDGESWLSIPVTNNTWNSITYGNGLFVAVASSGTGNRVMTSPDGITWTSRTSPADTNWVSVTYGNGLFVAVATNGTGTRIMYSSDGITWTIATSSIDNAWQSVTFGNGIFVAVASSGTGTRAMYSSDGINWTIGTSAADNNWQSVTYDTSSNLFIAISNNGTDNRVMTSSDGNFWSIKTTPSWFNNSNWGYSTFVPNGLIAVAQGGDLKIAISSDFINDNNVQNITGTFIINNINYVPNTTINLNTAITNSNVTDGFTYISSNSSVVSISETTATINSVGNNITITAIPINTYKYIGTLSTTFNIQNNIQVLTGTFTINNKTYLTDTIINLNTAITNSNIDGGGFTYTSSNPSIVSISGTTATINAAGNNITITATPTNTSSYTGTLTATFNISKAIPETGILFIENQLLSSSPLVLPNITKPLNHTKSWTYSILNNDNTGCIFNNKIYFNKAGVIKLSAILLGDNNYTDSSVITYSFIVSDGNQLSEFTFNQTESTTNSIIPYELISQNNTITISNISLTDYELNIINPTNGEQFEKEYNRQIVANTILNYYYTQNNVNIVNVPKSWIYLPSEINTTLINSVKLFNTNNTNLTTPLIVSTNNISSTEAIYVPLTNINNSITFTGTGNYSGYSINIRKEDGEYYTITKYYNNSILKVQSGLKGNIIYYVGLKLILGSITGESSNIVNESICFKEDTLVQTDQGIIPINKLNINNHTINKNKILAITQSVPAQTEIVCIEQNALGENIPSKTTFISNNHKIMYKNVMISVEHLANNISGIYKVIYDKEILYNILLENYTEIIINNIVAESLHHNNIVAKLYLSNLSDNKKNKLIQKINTCINLNDKNSYLHLYNELNI